MTLDDYETATTKMTTPTVDGSHCFLNLIFERLTGGSQPEHAVVARVPPYLQKALASLEVNSTETPSLGAKARQQAEILPRHGLSCANILQSKCTKACMTFKIGRCTDDVLIMIGPWACYTCSEGIRLPAGMPRPLSFRARWCGLDPAVLGCFGIFQTLHFGVLLPKCRAC